jgi:large subunit ribosomal protein L11
MGNNLEIDALVEGGKASGGVPIGPAVGPTGVPIKDVVDAINEKTKEFKGLKVPVTIIIDTEKKTFSIKVSTPMASALVLKELGIPKGSGVPNETFVGNLTMEQVIKITNMKRDSLNSLDLKTSVRTIIGTVQSMGITVDGKIAQVVLKDISAGTYDDQIKE